ncbi:MAG: Ni(II)/Co(II)-sensing transcriptional repressor DmeR [Pseudorhodoplanes sp.]
MSHTQHNKKKLIARINRLKGQMDAVERALDAGRPCGEVLQLLSSIRGALNGLTGEVLDDHLHEHVLHAADDKARGEAVQEISEVLRTYIR